MGIPNQAFDEFVSLERGEVDRRIFSDEEIFELEMERIFGRAWLFLCHDTQIPEAGDFFQAVMGRDNVLVVRQKDGSIKALLNTCAHRGNAVCRADEGNAKSFLCTYHGWSYGIDGRLKGVPGFKEFYEDELVKAEHSLPEVSQVASYHGFVFGTHDASAPSLHDYLGPTARLGLDQIAARGTVSVVPGIQKFVVDSNWKFAVDNVFDWYHPQVTHASAMRPDVFPFSNVTSKQKPIDMSDVEMQTGQELDTKLGAITGTTFDQLVLIAEYGHGIGGPVIDEESGGTNGWRSTALAQDMLGPLGVKVGGHPNVFPNLWVTTTSQVSLRIPRGPNQTEIWWFSFVDRTLPEPMQKRQITVQNHVFGAAGLLEQDDGENWGQATMQTHGIASRRRKHLVNMGLGRGKVIREHGIARIETTTNEHAQLWTYYSWAQWMKGLDWDALRIATTPPDVL
jgi:nitrite reductase/ring-hydroxylating ferredoxin subunit